MLRFGEEKRRQLRFGEEKRRQLEVRRWCCEADWVFGGVHGGYIWKICLVLCQAQHLGNLQEELLEQTDNYCNGKEAGGDWC
nr:hypothetical protein CFP56_48975 [Quercus suber]